jgi:hypothetical protein
MAAGMGHRRWLAHVQCRGRRGEGQSRGFLHGQRIHVGAQRHGFAGLGTLEQTHDAVAADASTDLHAQLAQVFCHQGCSACFLPGQRGMLVDVAPPCREFGRHRRDARIERL